MRKILEILKLHFEGKQSGRAIARSASVALATVQDCRKRFDAAGLTWPTDLDEAALTARMYPPSVAGPSRALPDFGAVQSQLVSHKAMTRRHLWAAYRAENPDGLGYSAFCDQYSRHVGLQKLVLRQTHAPGVAMMVDYAGPGLVIIDRTTGKQIPVRLFVAVLGYSNYTFACATPGETTADWLSAQVRALEAFGGVPETLIPDNPKALVSRACRWEPELNPAYQDFARHYGITVLPARVRKPRDKAKVETAVQIVERFLMPDLLAQRFFSLPELNEAITTRIAALNAKPFQKLEGNRASWFADEKPVLKPLPAQGYEFAQWKHAKVHLDYHIEVDRHCYSVPHVFVGKRVDVRLAPRTIEVFLLGKSIAVHARTSRKGGFTTIPEHRPPNHRNATDQNIERLYRQADAIGSSTLAVLRSQGQHRKHAHETLRSAIGILRLAEDFSPQALELACSRALILNAISYTSIRNLILHPPREPARTAPPVPHSLLRGPEYYAGGASC